MSYLYKLDFESSMKIFNHFLTHFKGENYIKSAYHKLAWIAFLQGEPEKKLSYFEKAIAEGSISIDEDKVALKDAKKNYITHSRLLRTRLFYDGGYYEEALFEINAVKIVKKYANFLDEHWYRLARVISKLDYADEDIVARYQKALDIGKESTSYFAPMSALQIGLIYENQNDVEQAVIYFEKCLSLSNFDYERGIHQKAKLGLARISD